MPLSINDHLLIEAAKEKGYTVEVISSTHPLLKISCGTQFTYIRKTMIWETRGITKYIAENKDLSYIFMGNLGFTVPKTITVKNVDQALAAAQSIGYPLVIKPNDSKGSQGVSILHQSNEEAFLEAFELAYQVNFDHVLIQNFVKGKDYRVLMLDRKVAAVAHREPASIYGDGFHNIDLLIKLENNKPDRGDGRVALLSKIKVTEDTTNHLAKQGLSLKYIPKAGEKIFLSEIGSMSAGGESIDYTDDLPPENIRLFERMAEALDAPVLGLDIRSEDITKVLSPSDYCIIEINHSPGFALHQFPNHGKPRNIAKMIVDLISFQKNYLD